MFKNLVAQSKNPVFLHLEPGSRVPYFLGCALRGQAPQILYAQCVSAALLFQRRISLSVRPWVFGPVPKQYESWHCFFFEILLTSGFRPVQNSLKKKEATGYFSCHKVTSHTEEMNNIRKTDPGYQKSSVS